MRNGRCVDTLEIWSGEIVNLPAFLRWAADQIAEGKDDPILKAIKMQPGVIDRLAQRKRMDSAIPGIEFKRMAL
jgi:hypothetical protein